MKIAGTPEQIFQHLRDNGVRFEAADQFGPKLAAGALATGTLAVGAMAISKRSQDKKLRQLVRQDVKKELKSKQGPGLNFDLI